MRADDGHRVRQGLGHIDRKASRALGWCAGPGGLASARWLAILALPLVTVLLAFSPPGANGEEAAQPEPGAEPRLGAPLDAGPGVEVTQMRTERSRTYRDPRGGYVARIFAAPVHFRNRQDEWQTIDNTLVPAGDGFDNRASAVDVDVPNSAASEARVSGGGHSISFSLEGAEGAASVDGATARYANALPGVDLLYTAQNEGLKEVLALTSPDAPTTFRYRLTTSPGLEPREERDGGVVFENPEGHEVATFAPPFMEDESGDDEHGFSDDVTLSLSRTEQGHEVTLRADRDWVRSERRKGKVVIDPTVVFTTASPDCKIANNATADTNYCSSDRFDVGSSDDGSSTRKRRSLLRFPIRRWLPKGADIFDAKLYARTMTQRTTTPIRIDVHDVSRSWTAGVTWNRYDGTSAWTSPGGDYDGQVVDSNPEVGGTLGWESWRVTQSVQRWADGANGGQNDGGNGLLLKQSDESTVQNDVNFASSEATSSTTWPHLDVWYDHLTGVLPYYQFEEEQLTDRLGMRVNVASGNLILQENDLSIPGTGLDLDVSRFYNGREPVVDHLGWGWSHATGRDVRLEELDSGDFVFRGPTGYVKRFRKSGDSYTKPNGVNATLTKHSDGTWTLKWNKSDEKWRFDSAEYLTEQIDKNNHRIAFQYDSNRKLTRITDTQDRVTSFAYDANGRMTSMTDPAGRVHAYAYGGNGGETGTSTLMTSYTDPAGKVTQYGYTGSLLTSVTDPEGKKTAFAYDDDRRVTSVTRGITATEAGHRTTYAYNQSGTRCPSSGAGNTVVTDALAHRTTYCWDTKGRVDEVYDHLDRKRSRRYDSNSNVTFAQGVQGGTAGYGTSGTFDASDNLTAVEQPGTGGQNGQKSSFSYDPSGTTGNPGANGYRLTESTNAQGNKQNLNYDADGNLRRIGTVTETNEAQTLVNIDRNGGSSPECESVSADTGPKGTVRCSEDGNGHETRYDYDAKGNLTKITPPSPAGSPLGPITYTYDPALSRPTSMTDGKGQKRTFAYDARDRVTRVEFLRPDATLESSVSYAYDADGNLTQRTDATGTTTYAYDARNLRTEESFPGAVTNRYAYDPAKNLTSFSDGGGTVTYAYDELNLVTQLTDPQGRQTTFAHNDDNSRTRVSFPNGVTETMSHDRAELTRIRATKGTAV